jgi:hypothetical protein
MSLVQHHGDEKNPIWVVISEPYDKDQNMGYLFSCGYGYNFKKIWGMGNIGISLPDPHIRSIRPCIGATYDKDTSLLHFLNDLDRVKPTFIVPLSDEVLNYLVPYTTQVKEKNSSLRKWAGSILTSELLNWPHYIIGCQPPDYLTRNWDEHEIAAFIDLGHLRDEYDYWFRNGVLNPLPARHLEVQPPFAVLLNYLNECLNHNFISVDIETIRPKKDSSFYEIKHPGYPYCVAVAVDSKNAMSFSYWDYTPEQCVKIWRKFDELLTKVPCIGQNFFSFDSHYKERLGFRICLSKCQDTLIRHHILWPGLEHKLQFQTKQYTRESFYKDEGKNFSVKYKDKFMIYNAKDAAVTYEIWERQEEEFKDRPQLR